MSYKVVKEVSLDAFNPTGNTRHFVNGSLVERFSSLQIAEYNNGSGYYLFYLDASGEEVTDTYHYTLEGALLQAESEFGVRAGDWKDC